MGRNYSQTTIKTLFHEARTCAYPDCGGPIIFRDRGAVTAVADIAHIRSESPSGPRHDPAYVGDLNGPENLLLLCGMHHRPVDFHESLYTIEELLAWKSAQVADAAGGGTEISDADVRSYARLSAEESSALAGVARLAQRLTDRCLGAQADIDEVRREYEKARQRAFGGYGPVYEIDDDGNRAEEPIPISRFSLSEVERAQWADRERAATQPHSEPAMAALGALNEEVAVLRMWAPDLAPWLRAVVDCAEAMPRATGDGADLAAAEEALNVAVSSLWAAANGESTPA